MQKIEFDQLPGTIQSVYSSRKKECVYHVRTDREGREFYYVKLDNETDTWSRKDGRWVYNNRR